MSIFKTEITFASEFLRYIDYFSETLKNVSFDIIIHIEIKDAKHVAKNVFTRDKTFIVEHTTYI